MIKDVHINNPKRSLLQGVEFRYRPGSFTQSSEITGCFGGGCGWKSSGDCVLAEVGDSVLYHTLSEPARAEYGGAPFHTQPMPECHKRAADLAGHRPAVTFSGQSDRQHATLAYRRMRLTVVNLGRS